MSGHVRPTVALIRAWFFLVGMIIIVCAMSLFDVRIEPIIAIADLESHTTQGVMR